MTRPTQDQKRRAEEAIAAIAARQHATVTRAQLLRAGMSGQTVQRWIDAKRLRVLHRGVYLVGPAPLPHTHLIAAVLACGPRSAISHISAGLL